MKITHGVDMLHGRLLGQMTLLAVPIMLSCLFQQLMNTVDVAVAGRCLSGQAMAAIGSNSVIISLFVTMLTGLSVGANVQIAAEIGKRRFPEAQSRLQEAMTFSALIGILFAVSMYLAAEPLLQAVGTPADIAVQAREYLLCYLPGLPFLAVFNFGSAAMRANGDSFRPLCCLVAASLLNPFLDWWLAVSLGMGVRGIALATAIVNLLSAVLVTGCLAHERGYMHLCPWKLKANLESYAYILRIGGPAALQGAVFALSNLVIQGAINSFGSAAAAGVAAAFNFEAAIYFIISGYKQAAVSFTSQNYAAQNQERCRMVFKTAQSAAFAGSLLASLLCLAGSGPLLGLFSSEPLVLEFAMTRMLIAVPGRCLASLYEIPSACLRGMEISLLPAVEVLFGSCLLRVWFLYGILGEHHDFALLCAIYPVSWLVTGAMVMATYLFMRRRLLLSLNSACSFW